MISTCGPIFTPAPGKMGPAVLSGDHDAVLQRVWNVHEGEGHCGIPLAVERDHLGEVDVRQRVARDDEERAVEIGAELPHRSAGAERRFLDAVAKAHAYP